MSLRVRLVLLTLVLVALVAVAFSLLEIETLVKPLSSDLADRAKSASNQVTTFLADHVTRRSHEDPPLQSLDEAKDRWRDAVAHDQEVAKIISQTMNSFPSVIEINIAGDDGKILASSDPTLVGSPLKRREGFQNWKDIPWYRKAQLILRGHEEAERESINAIVMEGSSDPFFTVQIVASAVLLRLGFQELTDGLAQLSIAVIVLSLVLALLATQGILRPLKRIETTIDRIVQGNLTGEQPEQESAKEFRVVESKLSILGQQFQGAQADASKLRKNLDQLLQQMESQFDVATRLAAISRLSGGVAHEIKNPLNAILLRLDLLKARLGEPEEVLAKELETISKEVIRLDRVVKTFLDFSRPVDVHLIELDLAALVKEVTDLVTPQARLAGIEMTYSGPDADSGSAWMRGDSDLLKQAVLNLVTNAMDAMSAGGKVGGKLGVSVSRDGEKLGLDVADNGPGIPEELRQKVFLLYFTTKTLGSGIGLAMVYRAVQLHNGTVSFTSETGVGTTFRLEFPAIAQHA